MECNALEHPERKYIALTEKDGHNEARTSSTRLAPCFEMYCDLLVTSLIITFVPLVLVDAESRMQCMNFLHQAGPIAEVVTGSVWRIDGLPFKVLQELI